MLRKRVSFRPNIAATTASASATTNATHNLQAPSDSDANVSTNTATTNTGTTGQSLNPHVDASNIETSKPSEATTPVATLSGTTSAHTLEPARVDPHQPADCGPNVSTTDSTASSQTPKTTALTLQAPAKDADPNSVISNEGVAEAIAQLTGHKFEPVKLGSINSANKNIKLKDLLFFNPPLTKDQKRHKKNESKRKKKQIEEERTRTQITRSSTRDKQVTNAEQSKDSDGSQDMATDQEATEAEPSLIPQVKMGPDGRLILDESSTVINLTNSIKTQDAIVEDSEDVISKTNYDSFRRRPSATNQSKWSSDDTQKFYHALTILGTDFSLMESLFFSGQRSRTELHKKFKREERMNKCKVDIALSNRISIDGEELEDLKEVFYK